MTIFQAVILGLIQGLTEFLPVSSSGHLALVQQWFALPSNMLTFDVVVHMGTLLAVVFFFRKELIHIISPTFTSLTKGQFTSIPPIVWHLAIGTIPAIVLGLFLKDFLETTLNSPKALSAGFLVTAMLLFLTTRFTSLPKSLNNMHWKDSLLIGFFQAIAIIPSISRSGSTIFASLAKGLNRKDAFTFSFLLSIPAIVGAQLLELPELFTLSSQELGSYAIGFAMATISGYAALVVFQRIVVNQKLAWFGYYCLGLGIVLFFLSK